MCVWPPGSRLLKILHWHWSSTSASSTSSLPPRILQLLALKYDNLFRQASARTKYHTLSLGSPGGGSGGVVCHHLTLSHQAADRSLPSPGSSSHTGQVTHTPAGVSHLVRRCASSARGRDPSCPRTPPVDVCMVSVFAPVFECVCVCDVF